MSRLRWGLVGGGEGAFIGAVHRIAVRLDDRFLLLAAAPSSDPARAQRSGVALRLAPDRVHADFRQIRSRRPGAPIRPRPVRAAAWPTSAAMPTDRKSVV